MIDRHRGFRNVAIKRSTSLSASESGSMAGSRPVLSGLELPFPVLEDHFPDREDGFPARALRRASISSIHGFVGRPSVVRGAVARTYFGSLVGFRSVEFEPLFIGLVSKASRLMLIKCNGEILSLVIEPPMAPGPNVMAGNKSVVKPTDPSAATELTTIRMAGFSRANASITFLEDAWIANV